MHWILAAIIVPVPLFHLWLHALLLWWRRFPYLLYVWGLVLWIGAFKFFPAVQALSPSLFEPSVALMRIGYFLVALGVLGFLVSLFSLGPVRFFVWAVLDPESAPKTKLEGVFARIPHPAYLGYVALAFGNLLASGKAYLAGVMLYLLVLTPLVIWMEEKELHERTGI